MSDTQNPWESPATDLEKAPETGSNVANGVITDPMRRYLGEASPWLRFLGVMSFIGIGFMALAGLIVMLTGSIASGTGLGAGMSFGIGLLYLVMAFIMLFPARFMWNFGSKIRAWKQSGNSQDLETALMNNKSLWKFSGIIMIIYLALIPIFLIIAAIGGVMSALM